MPTKEILFMPVGISTNFLLIPVPLIKKTYIPVYIYILIKSSSTSIMYYVCYR